MTDDHAPDIRHFVDQDGVEWSVRELETDDMRDRRRSIGPGDRRRTSWLLFLAKDGTKRRLSPHPADWRSMSERTLTTLNQRAVAVPPAPARRPND